MTMNYNNVPMIGITDTDYDTLLCHLSEQVAACMPPHLGCQRNNAATDALANTWQPEMTAREWLAAAGRLLGCDTSACVGA